MRLGLYTVANLSTGLGLVCRDIVKHCPVDSLFARESKLFPVVPMHPRQMTALSNSPDRQHITTYLDMFRPDVLLTVEIPYSSTLFDVCRERGVKTALIPMAEAYNPGLGPDLIICPTQHCYDKVQESNKVLWRLPIDLSGFPYRRRSGPPRRFVHVLGLGVTNGKRQTNEVVEGFMQVDGDSLQLDIYYQTDPLRWYSYAPGFCHDPRIRWLPGVADPAALYAEGDCLLAPDAYAGYGRHVLEALGCGLPVITTDAPPMNEVVVGWLVPVVKREPLVAGIFNEVRNLVSNDGIAEAIREAVGTRDWAGLSASAHRTARQMRWTQARTQELMAMLEAL